MTGIELFALPAMLGGGTATLGGVLGAASLVAGTAAQLRAANEQSAALRMQAGAQRVNADEHRQAGHNEVLAGEAEAARVQDQGRRQRASAFNTLAGSGVDASSGSIGALMDDLAAGSSLDASIARWRGTQVAAARERQAQMLEFNAGAYDARARQMSRAKWWQAGTTLLTGGRRLLATE